jgi:hypothetical protein
MASDLMFILPYQPGTLWRLTEAVADAGISVDGCSFQEFGPEGMIHLLVEDAAGARAAAEQAGFRLSSQRDVVVAPVQHRPGALAELLRPVADAGVSVNLVYLTRDGRAVIGVAPEELERARTAVGAVAG